MEAEGAEGVAPGTMGEVAGVDTEVAGVVMEEEEEGGMAQGTLVSTQTPNSLFDCIFYVEDRTIALFMGAQA